MLIGNKVKKLLYPFCSVSFCVCLLACLATIVSARYISSLDAILSNSTQSVNNKDVVVFVIDAGHGGEDGGASSASGALEKDINLSIALKLGELLELNGYNVLYTRTEDVMLDDGSASSLKKRRDLNFRLKMASSSSNNILVSIHQNSFPVPKYSGLQVYYSKNNEKSFLLAHTVQKKTKELLQHGNTRIEKAASSAIFLLDRVYQPAIMIECGFLSNEEEANRLADNEYQNALASVIFSSLCEFEKEFIKG